MIFQRFFSLFTLFLCLVACTAQQNDSAITPEELHSSIKNNELSVILDVRSKKEFKKGHLAGAIHIPLKQLPDRLSQLSDKQSEQIVVYCYAGPRAEKAIKILKQSGFSNAVELKGHYKAWKEAELPIEN